MANQYDVTLEVISSNKDSEWSKQLQTQYDSGLVRLLAIPELDYDLTSANEDLIKRAKKEGVFGLITERKGAEEWDLVEALWGFIGKDYLKSDYLEEMIEQLLEDV